MSKVNTYTKSSDIPAERIISCRESPLWRQVVRVRNKLIDEHGFKYHTIGAIGHIYHDNYKHVLMLSQVAELLSNDYMDGKSDNDVVQFILDLYKQQENGE